MMMLLLLRGRPFRLMTPLALFLFLLAGRSCCGSSVSEEPQQEHRRLNPLPLSTTWETITLDTFEDSTWGNYQSGGGQARLEAKGSLFAAYFASSISAVVRDDKAPPDSSFFHAQFHDISAYQDLQVDFWYYSQDMKKGMQFVVEYSTNGSNTWQTLEVMSQFQNQVPVQKTIVFSTRGIDVASINSMIKLRFRNKGKDRRTKVYVDQIHFQGLLLVVEEEDTVPSNVPSTPPSTPPTIAKSAVPTQEYWTAQDICPLDRRFPPQKYSVLPYTPASTTTGVEDDLSEVSYLAFSSQTDSQGNLYAYMASDKNQFSLKVVKFQTTSQAQVVVGTATTVATYALATYFANSDWEDIALGPCDDSLTAKTCIYIGDFGNNDRGGGYVVRSTLRILKLEEPQFDKEEGPVSLTNLPVTSILYSYSGSGFRTDLYYDAEALFVDWTGDATTGAGKGDIYIVTKGACTLGNVGKIPAAYHKTLAVGNISPSQYQPSGANVYAMPAVMTKPPKQGTITSCENSAFRSFQGADMTRDGRLMALSAGGSPPRVYFYPRETGETVVDALNNVATTTTAASCSFVGSTSQGLPNEKKFEAVAFLPDGKSYAEISECQGGSSCTVPLYIWDLVFPPASPDPRLEGVTPPASNDAGWATITYDDFESGDNLGNYINGTNANPYLGYGCPASATNKWSMLIYWHNGPDSSISHAANQDLSAYPWLQVKFDWIMNGFDHMDALFLELSLDGGATYFIVADWALDTQGIFNLNTCYSEVVVLHASVLGRATFGNQVRLRFRTSANAQGDKVYVDNIWLQGHNGIISV